MAIDYASPYIWDDEQKARVPNPNHIPGCERTYLIQRLEMPSEHYNGEWSFGCGPSHGGFSQEGWDIAKKLCRFDYMGSAEFEFGALPGAFQKMSRNADSLEAYILPVIGHPEFPCNRRFSGYEYDAKERIQQEHILNASVFVLAPSTIRLHVDDVILRIAIDDIRLQDPANMRETVFGSPHWEDEKVDVQEWQRTKAVGWLELNNGFAFFANEDMWLSFCRLFNVSIPNWPDIPIIKPDFAAIDEALAACPKHD